jgi:thymidine kinase
LKRRRKIKRRGWIDEAGRPIKDGRQIQIGGNERYVSVCRRHFKAGMCERADGELPLWDG